ncbi:hypothetical protein HQ545_01990 [Candidatus Woesearchaeota archaeon]|nr:hypothetical protein [Candidatus Woesearchaeota archaeon]
MKDPDTSEKVKLAHQILNTFKYNYNRRWVGEKELKYQSRMHNQVFNELVRRGFIEKRKTFYGYQYRWNAAMP